MQKIKTEEFEKELQKIDPRIMIVPNQNRPGASNVFLNGVDICPWIPQFEMQDEYTQDYNFNLHDTPIPFKTTTQVIEMVNLVLERLKQPEYADILFDKPLDVKEETYGQHKI